MFETTKQISYRIWGIRHKPTLPQASCRFASSMAPRTTNGSSVVAAGISGSHHDASMFFWLVVEPPDKYEFVSWDDDIPN